jgi:hypothetical protein
MLYGRRLKSYTGPELYNAEVSHATIEAGR